MSAQSQKNLSKECEHPNCDDVNQIWEMHHGKYCSNDCEVKHAGRQALGGLKFDHTHCFTCGSQLKEIAPPKPDHAFDVTGTGWTWDFEHDCWSLIRYDQEESRKSAVGFEHKTPNAGFGEKEHNERTVTGTVCDNCGNTDHTAHVPYLVETHTAAGFVSSYLIEEEVEFCVETLHREYVETEDIELATGRALET